MSKRQGHPGWWLLFFFVGLVLLALTTAWWKQNPLLWSLGTAMVFGGLIFILIKYPSFRRRAWVGLRVAGKDLSDSFDADTEERVTRRMRAHIPASIARKIERRARGTCEHYKCRHRLGLEFHHIDHNSSNSRYGNLTLFCGNHHDMADRDQFRKETVRRWVKENEAKMMRRGK